jgi:UDP-glucose 4-epimerase
VVLDNLSTGYRSAVLGARRSWWATPPTGGLVARLLREHDVETVMHFAAHTIVPESVSDPLKYYHNNTCATRNLLQCCERGRREALRVLVDCGGLRHPPRALRTARIPRRSRSTPMAPRS